MTSDEWGAICLLLDKGFKWREPFGKAQSSAYRMLLEGYSAEQLMTVIRALVARGQVFGPTSGEIVAEIRCDPSQPTFVEAYALIYGKGGILRARPAESTFGDEGERGRAYRAAQRARAASMHPLVASFVDRYGLDRLEVLPLNDPEFGDAKRRELERSWDEHVEAMDGRDVRVLASGRRGEGLARLDPLSALDLTPEARRLGIGSTP